MSKPPKFEIVEAREDFVLLRDLGPWDEHQTITNGAEAVVEAVLPMLNGRRLEYIDSYGERTQIVIKDGKFAGFW